MRATALLAVLLTAGIAALASRIHERRTARIPEARVSWRPLTFRDLGSTEFESEARLDRGERALERLDLMAAQRDFRRVIELGEWMPEGLDIRRRADQARVRLWTCVAMLEDR